MNRPKQEYSNHRHLVPSYHILTFTAMVFLLVGAVLYLFNVGSPYILPILIVLMVLTIVSVSFHSRSFALKAQDRAIRAEENLRYFILTGKRLDQSLSLRQVIALRFASDEEFVGLAAKAVEQKMKPDDIKKAVKHWRADYHRV